MNKEKLESAKNLFFIALGIDIAITAMVVMSDFWAIGVFKDINTGRITTDQLPFSTYDFWDSFANLIFLTILGVGLGLVKWLNTCYSYAKETIGASGFKNEGWTAGGWIIPIFNLFKPYQVINEIYKAGSPTYVVPDGWKKESGSGLLLAWWIFWAVTHFIGWAVGKEMFKSAMRDDMTLQQIIGVIEFHAWFCVMCLVVSGLWLVVANELTRRLLERNNTGNSSLLRVHSVAGANQTQVRSQSPTRPLNEVMPKRTSAVYSVAPLAEKSDPPALHTTTAVTEPAMNINLSIEEDHWATAMAELESGQRRPGVWAKAFAESEGDETKAKVAYLKARVQQLTDAASAVQAQQEVARQEAAVQAQQDAARQEAAAKAEAEALAIKRTVDEVISTFAKNKEISNEQLTFIVQYADKPHLISLCSSVTGNTLLHVCAERDMVAEVSVLLAAGADPSRLNNAGVRPEFMTSNTLIRQLCNGLKVSPVQLEVLIQLPQSGLCPNCGEVMPLADLTCPRCRAVFGSMNFWKVKVLDAAAMLVELKSGYLSGKKPTANQIRYLVAASISEKSLMSLVDQQKFGFGATLLHWCAHFDLMAEAKLLLENGANARAKTSKDLAPYEDHMPYEWCKNADLRRLLEVAALGE